MENQTNHTFWGIVAEDWAGFSAEVKFSTLFFEEPKTIFLGDEYDEDCEESDIPTKEQLDDYVNTYLSFMESIESVVLEMKQLAHDRYNKYYASSYESENPPLIIDSIEKHAAYMQNVIYIRISDNGIIRIPIRYELDEEHGLEFKIQSNRVVQVEGIANT